MKVPETLLDLQRWMGRMLVCPLRDLGEYRLPSYDASMVAEIEARITAGPHLTAAQRVGIHNQQYWFRLFTLMQEHYPILTRLFGYFDFNRRVVEPYLLKYPPDDWSLATLGSRLPQWIAEEYCEEDRELVYQMATIEEAHKRLRHVQPLPPLKKEELSKVAEMTLFLQPTVILFALDAELFAFRLALLEREVEAEEPFPEIEWFDQKHFYLLFLEEELFYEEISREEYVLLKAFEKGAKIGEALVLLDKREVPVGEWFQKWAERKWITNVKQLYNEK